MVSTGPWSSAHEEMIDRLSRLVPEDGSLEPVNGVQLNRASSPTGLHHSVFFPAFCVIAQGRKEVLLGERLFWYDSEHYMIATAELPITTQVTVASREQPYLSLILGLDPSIVSSVMLDAGRAEASGRSLVTGIDVSPLEDDLFDAVLRLVRLLEAPAEAAFLMPLVVREIVYRLMIGEQSDRLAHIAALGSNTQRLSKAIERFRREFHLPLKVEDLARQSGMSVSGFHHHFKALTAMSPLQFQKQLRLQEARRLLLAEGMDAASAGYRVGYDDASHFNREYKRLFGEPPLRDIERLKHSPSPGASQAQAS